MADRKRKRKRHATPAAGGDRVAAPRNGSTATPEAPAPAADTSGGGKGAMTRGYAKAEQKNQSIRDALDPLAEGERPRIVVIAALWLLVIAANMVYNAVAADGVTTGGRIGNVFMIALVLAASIGTWQLRYWAILGTQTILALAFVFAVLAALVLSDALLILLVLAGALISGWIFLKMVKVMARVQKTELLRREAAKQP